MSNLPPDCPLPFADLVVIDDREPHSGALNMALDEVLLGSLECTPLLRCYRWSSPTVSLGCFGKIAAVRASYPEMESVRRWTGGGIVEHGNDFTYTLFVPRNLPLSGLPPSESYRVIHGAVAAALAAVGWAGVEPAPPENHPPIETGSAPFLKPCFAHPVPYDLLAAGQKIAGGAQRRTQRGLLHQGSIQGAFFAEPLHESRWREVRENLAGVLTLRAVCRPITTAEFTVAHALAARKYGTPAWTERF